MSGTSTPDKPPEEDYAVGTIQCSNENTARLTLGVDRIAVYQDRIMFISVYGNKGYVKQFRALMQGAAKNTQISVGGIKMYKPSDTHRFNSASTHRLYYEQDRYTSEQHSLNYDKTHMMLFSKAQGFIPVLSDRAIFDQIKRSSVANPMTTPFIPEWMEWAKNEMKLRGYLAECHCYRCNSGVFKASSKDLDAMIERGLRSRSISIPGPPITPRVDLGEQLVFSPSQTTATRNP